MNSTSFLLVDQNSVTRRELREILEYLGYKGLSESDNASDAWTMLRLKSFDCIISAWEMPEMSGLAFLRVVRTDDRYVNLPFFLTDSAFTKPKVIEAGRAGVTGLIVHPYQVETIKGKVAVMAEVMGIGAPSEAEISLEEGMKLLEAQDHEGALKIFEKLISEGESAEVYYNIGYIKTAQGKYEEAIEAFRKATQIDRMFAKAYEAMGRAYKALGRSKEAEESLNKAAELYLSTEKDENAEEILNEILELSPETVNVYNSLGILYRKKGDLPTALKQYMKALKIHPNEPHIYYNIGRLHVEMKDLKAAQSYFRKALTFDSNFKEAREALDAMELGAL
ncbi:MAG: tetratricopeptide repeat protein [Deltaproteobacteria bacterium]|nr:tetratricopeptide repeat protein [Deltaproteobacteria bacterium]MBW2021116.1 tetratricopeptide repeat protein [Deltaproteobacteria bacterium]MBW2075823.1 tetratricopeptide repeat protein [Deltaproteobacteria bacterium]RLB82445.1 MAG: hypothetical protein DRH17_05935 [Deltaproteobacteria bacterium]